MPSYNNPPLVTMSAALKPGQQAEVKLFIMAAERASKAGRMDMTEAFKQWRIYRWGRHYSLRGRRGR